MHRLEYNTNLNVTLAGAISTNAVTVFVAFTDKVKEEFASNDAFKAYGSGNIGGQRKVRLSEAADTLLCEGPPKGVIRNIDSISCYNNDTMPIQLLFTTVLILDTETIADDAVPTEVDPVYGTIVAVSSTVTYSNEYNWKTTDENGAVVGVGATGGAGPGVPIGGATDEVLAKVNGTDYNTYWRDVDSFIIAMAAAL